MKKLIDIPDEIVRPLKKLSVENDMSFKKFIEYKLTELVKKRPIPRKDDDEEDLSYLDRQ